jgi:ubiquinone/menaquinone biosynthesis C-methylase UbiE
MPQPIPVVIGKQPDPNLPEYRELLKYESGIATEIVKKLSGKHADPWLNALDHFEPGSPAMLQEILKNPRIAGSVHRRVIDVAAGTCWATAILSQLEHVTDVIALDLSQTFLTTVGDRVINHFSGERNKIRFAVSTFNAIPFQDSYFDCAFFIATLHHSQTPLLTLSEIHRVLAPEGTLLLVQSAPPMLGLRRAREESLKIARDSGFTNMTYSRSEIVYLLQCSGFRHIEFHPMDHLIGGSYKRAVRHLFRRLNVENLLLPVTYLFEARK